MNQGICSFSGYTIPKGSGVHKVGNDGKLTLTRSGKERNLISMKISARDCKWTQSSRAFFKKTNKSVKEHNDFVYVTKIVRGFTLVPKALVSETPKNENKNKKVEMNKKSEKVNLNSNLRR